MRARSDSPAGRVTGRYRRWGSRVSVRRRGSRRAPGPAAGRALDRRACRRARTRRSARPRRPEPRSGSAPPTPSSRDAGRARGRSSAATLTRRRRGVRVLDDVRERLGDDEVGGRLDARGQPLARALDARPGSGEREASISSAGSRPRSQSTAGWMPRASSRSSSSACEELLLGALEQRPRLVRRLLDLRAREPQRERERDEALLRAVVEVPLQAAPLGRLDLHDPLPRRVDLALVLPCARDVDAAEEVALLAVLVDDRDAPPGDAPRPAGPCQRACSRARRRAARSARAPRRAPRTPPRRAAPARARRSSSP